MGDTYEEVVQITMKDQTVQATQDLQKRLDQTTRQLNQISSKTWSVKLNVVDMLSSGVSKALNAAKNLVAGGISIPMKVAGGIGGAVKGAVGGALNPQNLMGIGMASVGIQAVSGAAQGLMNTLGFGLGTEMENTSAQMMAFTKDAGKTAEIMDLIKTRAAVTPFSFQEMAQAAAGLLPVTKSSGIGLEDLMKQAEILAASNPMQGFEGAVFAMREALTGDFVSITDRFNLSRADINKWKAAGVSNFEIIQKSMQAMGYDADLVANMGGTMTGRWSTFVDTLHDVQRALVTPLFDRVSKSLGTVQKILDANMDTFKSWASTISNAVGGFFDRMGVWLGGAVRAWEGLQAAFSIDAGGMGIVMDALRTMFGDQFADWIEPGVQAFQRMIPAIKEAGGWIHYAMDDLMKGDFRNAAIDISIAFERITGINLMQWWQGINSQLLLFQPTVDRVGKLVGFLVDRFTEFTTGPGPALVTQMQGVGGAAAGTQITLQGLADVVNGASGAVEALDMGLQDSWHWLEQNKAAQAAIVGVAGMLAAVLGVLAIQWAINTAAAIAATAATTAQTIATQGATVAMGLLNLVMSLNPFALVAIAIVGVVSALVFLYNTSEDFRNVVDPILTWFGQAWDFLWHNAVEPAIAGIIDLFHDLTTEPIQTLATLPLRLMGIGLDIMNGLIKGFTGVDVLGWIKTNIVDAIPQFIKDALGIHSPSSVLSDIGAQIMGGLLQGLQSKAGAIQSFVGGIGGGITSALSGAANVAVGGGEIAQYISQAAQSRGIDPNIALTVAQHEGGVDEPAKRGTFNTGSSWWPFQLHYGGPGYEQYGNVAGMGNTFTAQTGFQPGDPAAWKASVDYALDYAKAHGWGAWYGAAAAGIYGMDGIGAAKYDQGGFLPMGTSLAINNTGAPEPVLGPGQTGGVTIAPAAGSVVINVGAGAGADSIRAILPQIADELWGLFGAHVLEAAGNQA